MGMRRPMVRLFCLLSSLFLTTASWGETGVALEVKRLGDGVKSPRATLAEVAWLEGRRIGQGFGGEIEEIWTAASGDGMAGLFRLSHGGEVTLYEIFVVLEREGSLELRVKHLAPDLGLWDGGEDENRFRLVEIDGQTAYFDGITYRRQPDGSMDVALRMGTPEKGERMANFTFRPVALREGGGKD